MDAAQSVIVAGWVGLSPTNSARFVTKYDSLGTLTWTNLQAGADLVIRFLAIDPDGNVVLGTNEQDVHVAKLHHATGAILWQWAYDTDAETYDWISGITVDGQGNIYVAGSSGKEFSSRSSFLLQLSAAGDPKWRVHPGFGIGPLGMDRAGNVCIAGAASEGGYMAAKYTSSGDLLWSSGYRGPAGLDRVAGVGVDRQGSVFVAGTSEGSRVLERHGRDYLVVKFSADGKHLWSSRFDGGFGEDARSLIVDDTGNAYVSGYYFLVKFSPQGLQLWSIINFEPKLATHGNALIVGTSDTSQLALSGRDFLVQKLVPNIAVETPRVAVSPATQRVPLGGRASFSAVFDGADASNYRWHFSGWLTHGAHPRFRSFEPSLVITNVAPHDVGEYWIEALTPAGIVASPVVRLEVLPQLMVFTDRTLWVHGNFTYRYQLQRSVDLRTWSVVTNFVPRNGSWSTSLDSLGLTNGSSAFFRAIELPLIQ